MNHRDERSLPSEKNSEKRDYEKWGFQLSGLSCASCAAAVDKALRPLPGIKFIEINPLTQNMFLELDPKAGTDVEGIISSVQAAGYGAALREKRNGQGLLIADDTDSSGEDVNHSVSQRMKANAPGEQIKADYEAARKRFIHSLFFAIPLLYISMGPMLGLPLPNFLAGASYTLHNALTQFLLTLPVLYMNRELFMRGFLSLWKRSPNMDALIALGSASAVIYGLIVLYQMATAAALNQPELLMHLRHSLYFESGAVILTFISLGKFLEGKAKHKTSVSISELMDLAPKTAWVERDGHEYELALDKLVKGDIIVIKPGAKVPVDGVVISGFSSLDASALNGESIPVEKLPGDAVLSGMVNQSGSFRFEATSVGDDTTLAQIIKLVVDASASKAPISRLADRISAVFVPLVILLALLTFAGWIMAGGGFEAALRHAITVLVISCPCALGLATPVAIMVGTGEGAKHGILLRSAESLETAGHIHTLLMDKTGTLTEGKPRLSDIVLRGGSVENMLAGVAALEKSSEHPLASAVLAAAEAEHVEPAMPTSFEAVPGRGVRGIIDGSAWRIGSARFMQEEEILGLDYFEEPGAALAASGKTLLYVAQDGQVSALLAVSDRLRAGSRAAVAALKKRHVRTVMLSGDTRYAAAPLAAELGMDDVIAELMPQDKVAVVEEEVKKDAFVMMVGDGMNDAPALASASVGVAMGSGTDLAMDSADIVLLTDDPRSLVTLIDLSRATLRNIKQNFFWAFFYNVLGIPLAAGLFSGLGLNLSPMFAAAAMSFSSLFVVSNALRLRRFKAAQISENKQLQRENSELQIHYLEDNRKEEEEGDR